MATTINTKKLNKIRDNYPNTWQWMQYKATWEHMCMGAVLNHYEEFIDDLIREEINAYKKGLKHG